MRSQIIAPKIIALMVVVGSLVSAPAAFAAPTCQTETGGATRCNTPGAMPVGWVMPAEQRQRLKDRAPPPASIGELLPGLLFIVCFLSLFALMPEFDGANDSDWDPQANKKQRK